MQVIDVRAAVEEFAAIAKPLEAKSQINVFIDACTDARFCEVHISAKELVDLGTIDVPLDPEEQGAYRANREIVADHGAFVAMKEDAKKSRSFSNLVAEYSTSFDEEHPIKIIGGQHRFTAIKEALETKINAYHGLKIYFGLDSSQRLDVQLVSNTVIAVSSDLYDRMQETVKGPELRNWCQHVGILGDGQDFSDRRQRGSQITVRGARTFIVNFFEGKNLNKKKFEETKTIPILCRSGQADPEWEKIRQQKTIWKNPELDKAGREFAQLVESQRKAFPHKKNADAQEKASSYPVIGSWAFVAGWLQNNPKRLERHYDLANAKGRDPLNAAVMSTARHKSDPENYRGLGTRTSPKDRGRLVELFYLQAEEGKGITKATTDLALKKYHAKEAHLDVIGHGTAETENDEE
jgi:hypothetical protein